MGSGVFYRSRKESRVLWSCPNVTPKSRETTGFSRFLLALKDEKGYCFNPGYPVKELGSWIFLRRFSE